MKAAFSKTGETFDKRLIKIVLAFVMSLVILLSIMAYGGQTAYGATSLSLTVTKQAASALVEAQVSLEESCGVLILALYDGNQMLDIFVDNDLSSVQPVSLSFAGHETSEHLRIKGFIWSSLMEMKLLIAAVEHPFDPDGGNTASIKARVCSCGKE